MKKNDNQSDDILYPLMSLETLFSHYIEKQVIYCEPVTQGNTFYAFKFFLIAMGMLGGLPWIHPALQAGRMLPSIQKFLSVFFGAGAVISVGSDGAWIMNEVAHLFSEKRGLDKLLGNQQVNKWRKYIQPVTISLCALASIVAAVYGAYTYNEGKAKLWAVLVAGVHLGYGIYGFNKLVEKVDEWRGDFFCQDKEAKKLKSELIKKLEVATASRQHLNFTSEEVSSTSDYLKRLLSISTDRALEKNSRVRGLVQLSAAIIFPVFASLVTVLLAYKAYQNIWNIKSFCFFMTLFSELPNFILAAVSTYEIFGKLFDLLPSRNVVQDNHGSLIRQSHPVLMSSLAFLFFIISIAAPAPGAYITYSTLGDDENISSKVQIAGTVSVSIARIILANFTMNRWGNFMAEYFYKNNIDAAQNNIMSRSQALQQFSAVLRKARPEVISRCVAATMSPSPATDIGL